MDWGGWELRLRPAIPSGFISLWTPNRAGYTARTMADRLGSKFQKTAGFGGGAGTSTKLPSIRKTRTSCMCRILPSIGRSTGERASPCSKAIQRDRTITNFGLIQMMLSAWFNPKFVIVRSRWIAFEHGEANGTGLSRTLD